MIDLNRYGDDVALTTKEIAEWFGISTKSVLALPIDWLPRRKLQFEALAGEAKRAYLGDRHAKQSRRRNLSFQSRAS